MADRIDIDRVGGLILFNGEAVAEIRQDVPPSILDEFYREMTYRAQQADD